MTRTVTLALLLTGFLAACQTGGTMNADGVQPDAGDALANPSDGLNNENEVEG